MAGQRSEHPRLEGVADDGERMRGEQRGVEAGHDVAEESERFDVRRVAEVPEEHEAAALLEGPPWPGRILHERHAKAAAGNTHEVVDPGRFLGGYGEHPIRRP
jgi:hypothetical protein